MATGDIELDVDEVELLGMANSKLPITVREKTKVRQSALFIICISINCDLFQATELVRMTYRYLDLRFPEMQSRMRFRSAMLAEMRKFLGDKCGFVEVETPTLFKRTPGVSLSKSVLNTVE
jgi:aspartyl-tRNA synthetase